jgi:hypothetical protein
VGCGVAKYWGCNVAKCLWCRLEQTKREMLRTSVKARLVNVSPVPGSRFEFHGSILGQKSWGLL